MKQQKVAGKTGSTTAREQLGVVIGELEKTIPAGRTGAKSTCQQVYCDF